MAQEKVRCLKPLPDWLLGMTEVPTLCIAHLLNKGGWFHRSFPAIAIEDECWKLSLVTVALIHALSVMCFTQSTNLSLYWMI